VFSVQFYIVWNPFYTTIAIFSVADWRGGWRFFPLRDHEGVNILALFEAVRLPRCRWALKPMWRSEYWPVYLLPFDASSSRNVIFAITNSVISLADIFHRNELFAFCPWHNGKYTCFKYQLISIQNWSFCEIGSIYPQFSNFVSSLHARDDTKFLCSWI